VTAIGNSLEAVLTAVCAGFGAGILPVHAARPFDHLERLPFPAGGLSVPFYIVFRKDAERHPAVTAFLKTFRKHAKDTRVAPQV
jgi:DNA-binding transcriptional LysR family regulator